MIKFTLYDKSSGEIYCSGDCLDLKSQEFDNYVVLEGLSNYETDFVDISNSVVAIKKKYKNPTTLDKMAVIADGVDKIMLTNIPIDSIITINNITQRATSTTVDLVFDIPGTYNLKVKKFPYLPFEAVINAN